MYNKISIRLSEIFIILCVVFISFILFAPTANALPDTYAYPTTISGVDMRSICGSNIDWIIRYKDDPPTDRSVIHIYKAQGEFHTTGSVSSLLVGQTDVQAFITHHDDDHVGLALTSSPNDVTLFTCRGGALDYHPPEIVPLREWLDLTLQETELTSSSNIVDGEEDDCFENIEWSIAFWNTGIDIAKCTFSVLQDLYNFITDFDLSDELKSLLEQAILTFKAKLGGVSQLFDLGYTFISEDILGNDREPFGQQASGTAQRAKGFWSNAIDKSVRQRQVLSDNNKECPEGFACGNVISPATWVYATAVACGHIDTRLISYYPSLLKNLQGKTGDYPVLEVFSNTSGKCEIKYTPLYSDTDEIQLVPEVSVDWLSIASLDNRFWRASKWIIQAGSIIGSILLVGRGIAYVIGDRDAQESGYRGSYKRWKRKDNLERMRNK